MKMKIVLSLFVVTQVFAVNFRENQSVVQRKTLIAKGLAELEKKHKGLNDSQYKSEYRKWKKKIKSLSKRVCVNNGDCTIGADISYDSEIKASITPYFERNGEVLRLPNLAFPIHSIVLSQKKINDRLILVEDMYRLIDFKSYSKFDVERRDIYDDFSSTKVYENKFDTVKLGNDQDSKSSVAFLSHNDSVYFDRGYFKIKNSEAIPSSYVYIRNGVMYSTLAYNISLIPIDGFNNSDEVESFKAKVLYSTDHRMSYSFNKVIGDGLYLKEGEKILLANDDFSVDEDFGYEIIPGDGSSSLNINYQNPDLWTVAEEHKKFILDYLRSVHPDHDWSYKLNEAVDENPYDNVFTPRSMNVSHAPYEFGGSSYPGIFAELLMLKLDNLKSGISIQRYISPKVIFDFLAEINALNKLRGIKITDARFAKALAELISFSSDTFGSNHTLGIEEIIIPRLGFQSIEDQRDFEKKLPTMFPKNIHVKYENQSLSQEDLKKRAKIKNTRVWFNKRKSDYYKVMIIDDIKSPATDMLQVELAHYEPKNHVSNSKVSKNQMIAYAICKDVLEGNFSGIEDIKLIDELVYDSSEYKWSDVLNGYTYKIDLSKKFSSSEKTVYFKEYESNEYYRECSTNWSYVFLHPRYGKDSYGVFFYDFLSIDRVNKEYPY